MTRTTTHDVIAIGASAGGFHVLLDLVSQLPASLPAAVLVVLHIGAQPSQLPRLLGERGPNSSVYPYSGEQLRRGTIFVAPPDCHMLLHGNSIQLSHGPKEHHARPAIDPMFRSVAIACRSRAIAVVLSGRLDDGTAGAQAIKQSGGLVVVQDPRDAEQPSMPDSVREHVSVDACVPSALLAETLVDLIGKPVEAVDEAPPWVVREQRISEGDANAMEDLDILGAPSRFSCPDCGGVLWEIGDCKPRRFRCHTGHAFSLRSLDDTQETNTNRILWSAIRALQERERLLTALAQTQRERKNDEEADRLDAQTRDVQQHRQQLHAMVVAE